MPDDPQKKGQRGESTEYWVHQQMLVFRRTKNWQPATDVYETPEQLTVIVELAGMREGDFTINLVDHRLIITGKRVRPVDDNLVAYHQLEVLYGDFRTEVSLPWAVDRNQITAVYEDGFLRIHLPRLK